MNEMSGAPLLRIRNLTKHFVQRRAFSRSKFTVEALCGVDLMLQRRSTLTIVGESGAGKSTLVRCLALLEAPSDGEIYLEGVNLSALRRRALIPYRRQIQLIFQDPASALNPALTAGEIVAEPLEIQHEGTRSQIKQRTRAMMEQVGLPVAAENKRPLEFSGGQRQRLAIARALIMEPKILILDEALSRLDLANREMILRLLEDLQISRALTFVHVCHDLRMVSELGCEVAVMHEGRIVEQQLAADLFASPRHPHTQELLGAMHSMTPRFEEQPV